METFERNPWRLVWQGLPVFHCEVLLLGPCKVTLITCWMSKVSHFTWPTSWISTWRIIYSSVAEGPVTKDLIGVDMGWLVSSSYLKGMARTQSYTHIHVCIVCIYNIQKDYIYIYTTWNTYILTGRAHILWTAIKMLVESFWLLSNYLPCVITLLFFVNVTSASSFVFINHDRWKDQYLCEAKQHITAVAQVPRWFDRHWSSLKFNFLEGRRIDSVVAILDRLEFQCTRAFLCCLIMYQALFDFFATSRHPVLKAS